MKMVVKTGGGNAYGAGNCDVCGDGACGGDGGGDDDDDDADGDEDCDDGGKSAKTQSTQSFSPQPTASICRFGL